MTAAAPSPSSPTVNSELRDHLAVALHPHLVGASRSSSVGHAVHAQDRALVLVVRDHAGCRCRTARGPCPRWRDSVCASSSERRPGVSAEAARDAHHEQHERGARPARRAGARRRAAVRPAAARSRRRASRPGRARPSRSRTSASTLGHQRRLQARGGAASGITDRGRASHRRAQPLDLVAADVALLEVALEAPLPPRRRARRAGRRRRSPHWMSWRSTLMPAPPPARAAACPGPAASGPSRCRSASRACSAIWLWLKPPK